MPNTSGSSRSGGGVQTIPLSERTTTRLLECWLLAQGAKQVAEHGIAAANALATRYLEEIATVTDVPEGAQVHVDFAARVLTLTPTEAGGA